MVMKAQPGSCTGTRQKLKLTAFYSLGQMIATQVSQKIAQIQDGALFTHTVPKEQLIAEWVDSERRDAPCADLPPPDIGTALVES
jgi:hypothetical protein